jgi:DNA-binding NarL/FixJ family response regulator
MSTSRIRVLLVDDHHRLRAQLCEMLQDDHQVAVIGEAADGAMAVDFVRRFYPDIVVMDVQMPTMNGIEATRQIKATCPDVTVIGLSSSNYAESMLKAGASAYIVKQYAAEELCDAIRLLGHAVIPSEDSGLRLLLIDDDPVLLKSIAEALHSEHPAINIVTAISAEQGLHLLRLARFDVIISDVCMAGLNGVDLLKECKARNDAIPVILMTGYGTPALEQDVLDQGASAILQKPVDPEGLYDLATRVIHRARCTHTSVAPRDDRQVDEFA